MKILIASYAFAPSVGGIETASELFAIEWLRQKHEIIVVTNTPSKLEDNFPYMVVRNPSLQNLAKLISWSDIIFQNNISLNLLWPNILIGRPVVVTVQTWIGSIYGPRNIYEKIKRQIHRLCTCVAISQAVADHLPVSSTILPNPYPEDIFHLEPDVDRSGDFIFVGRLVTDKGLGILLKALSLLGKVDIRPKLTIVGDGPERKVLEGQCESLNLHEQVKFLGVKRGRELSKLLNAHRVLVVPSLWAEPFGIVALEGIACGCAVVGSKEGGLAEAIGPCGILFTNGNSEALADCLGRILAEPETIQQLTANRETHLNRFKAPIIARQYLDLFERLV